MNYQKNKNHWGVEFFYGYHDHINKKTVVVEENITNVGNGHAVMIDDKVHQVYFYMVTKNGFTYRRINKDGVSFAWGVWNPRIKQYDIVKENEILVHPNGTFIILTNHGRELRAVRLIMFDGKAFDIDYQPKKKEVK